MNYLKNIILLTCLSIFYVPLNGQVKLKMVQLADGKTYQVSLIPEMSYASPMNTTSTAQITLKAPTGGFEVDQIFNLNPAVIWEPSSLTVAPEEAPEFDYISFTLISIGTRDIEYQAGVEVPLFAFTNFLECQGDIVLMDNANDPFMPPNSRNANIGNQITILGAKGDAYIGNAAENTVSCTPNLTNIEVIERTAVQLHLYPNPAANHLTVDFNWLAKKEAIHLAVRDLSGKLVRELPLTIQQGGNRIKVDIQALAQGNYFVELVGEEWKIVSEQFLKMSN